MTSDNSVLYIDDENLNLMLFEATYARQYNIVCASSTAEAETAIKKNKFKVIISDIQMPNETGLDFFKRLHFTDYQPIFIILTAFVSNSLLLEALNQGRIFRYLTKPWNVDELKFTIDQAIQTFDLHEKNQQLYRQIIESEKKFYNIFQNSQDGIVIFDLEENIIDANHAFIEFTNKKLETLKENKISELIPPEAKTKLIDRIKNVFQSFPSISEFSVASNKNEKRFIEANSCVIDFKDRPVILSVLRDITERKVGERKILTASIKAEETERSRIAKDLHDGLGPIMATLKMYLEWLNSQERVADHPDILDLSLSTINEAISTIKTISNNISPHILERFGIIPALSSFIEKVKIVSSLNFKLNSNIKDRFDPIIEISLYRIICECINNTMKHAKATDVIISINKSKHSIDVEYFDNGIGFDMNTVLAENKGMGLHNMLNRIKTLEGKIKIQSSKNQGFRINITIQT